MNEQDVEQRFGITIDKTPHRREVLLVPQKPYLNGKLFSLGNGNRGYEIKKPLFELREHLKKQGIHLCTIDESRDIARAEAIVFFEMPEENNIHYWFCLKHKMQGRMFLVVNEPAVVHPPNHDPKKHEHFKRILTWNDDLVDGVQYLKFHYTIPIKAGEPVKMPVYPFGQKKLLCMVAGNKYSPHQNELYSERIKAIRFMEKNHLQDFDLYGQDWDVPIITSGYVTQLKNIRRLNAGIRKLWGRFKWLPRSRQYPSYRGRIGQKSLTLPKYKFTIAYENEIGIHGYITEKILEAFLCGCVPVYLGDAEIGKAIPQGCFIDKREYETYEELYSCLSSMGEVEHSRYLAEIGAFLNSKAVYPFTLDAYVENFMKLIEVSK
jgi:hypothetical protein